MKENYGIVVDSGSSGSRIYIYKWDDPSELQKESADPSILNSVPKLIQKEEWTLKTTPGLSTFGSHPQDVWSDHFKSLIKFAEDIIPTSKHHETEIYVQATAGMRLIPSKQRENVLQEVCKSIQKNSEFKISSCKDHIQVIDGETEGIYGWIGLNYLKGSLNNYDISLPLSSHDSYGFMDMGGASTQISFVPSNESDLERHKDDLYSIVLRNVNGEVQKWPIFVSTWLGFGANEARKRHIRNLIMQLPPGVNYDKDGNNMYDLYDPCAPRGMRIEETLDGITYEITGSGDYQMCMRNIYPLLLKNLPCKDDPCLFNGVHAPTIDFTKNKFVGVSEYWYTANDVFHMGGEYNFLKFEDRLREFCELDWKVIESKWKNKDYGNFINAELLRDSCFKASWIVSVLHEGFGLPRLGVDTEDLTKEIAENEEKLDKEAAEHIPFQSANLIDGAELSWTTGKMLLVASNQIPTKDFSSVVGIIPSEQSMLLQPTSGSTIPNRDYDSLAGFPIIPFIFLVFTTFLLYTIYTKRIFKTVIPLNRVLHSLRLETASVHLNHYFQKVWDLTRNVYYSRLASQQENVIYQENVLNSNMEEGLAPTTSNKSSASLGSLRTRSTINLSEQFDNSSPRATNKGLNMSPSMAPSLYSPSERQSMPVLPTVSSTGEFMGKKYNKQRR